MFRKVLKLRSKALRLLSISIGNGDSTFFWWDPWSPFGSLYKFLGSDGPSRLGIPLFATIAELWSGEGWSLPHARSEKQVLLHSYMSDLQCTSEMDRPVWSIYGKEFKIFSSRAVWNVIRITKPEQPWASLVWHKVAVPRHQLTAWLFILNRNPTLDRMAKWGYETEGTCLLCGDAQESRNHLFFECTYSGEVWTKLTTKLNVLNPPFQWQQILLWLPSAASSNHTKLALLQGWQGAIYEIWRERNRRYHDGITLSPEKVMKLIISLAKNKCIALQQLGSSRGNSILQRWNENASP